MPFHSSPGKKWAESPTCVFYSACVSPLPQFHPPLPSRITVLSPWPALGKRQVKWSLPFNPQIHPAPALPDLLLVTSNAGILGSGAPGKGLRKDPLHAGGLPWGGKSPLSSDSWVSPTGSCILCYCLSGVPGGSTPEWPSIYSASCKQK